MSEVKNSDNRLKEDMAHYRKLICYMEANVPIQVLCLPKALETALLSDGCLRVYDLLNRDLRKIKGVGKRRLDFLTSRLDEFLTISV
jgi:hypothetical protein